MRLEDLIIEVFYHIGGLGLVLLAGHILFEGFRKGLTPSLLGFVVLVFAGWYLGSICRNLYKVIVLKEKYNIGI